MGRYRYRTDRHSFGWQESSYHCKGDPFTRGHTPAPYLRATGRRADGSSYMRRARTDELENVTPQQALSVYVGAERKQRAEGQWLLRSNLTLPAIPLFAESPKEEGEILIMTAVPQHLGGVRYWWRCPRCERRAGVVYFAEVPSYFGLSLFTGCRICLGLTYASQAKRGTSNHDLLVLDSLKSSNEAWAKAAEREAKRHDRLWAGLKVIADHYTDQIQGLIKR